MIPLPAWMLALGAVLAVASGYVAAVGMDAATILAKRWFHASREDVVWWTLIILGTIVSALVVLPTMRGTCEPGYTCHLLP